MIEIILPWPPSALSPNTRQHYMALARAKKAYRSACWFSSHHQGLRKLTANALHLSIEFVPPSRRAFDLDNCLSRLKAGLDAIADITGVDDKHWSLSISRSAEIGGMVRVKVEVV